MVDPRVEILTNWMDEYSVIDGQFARDQAACILAALDAARAPDPRDEKVEAENARLREAVLREAAGMAEKIARGFERDAHVPHDHAANIALANNRMICAEFVRDAILAMIPDPRDEVTVSPAEAQRHVSHDEALAQRDEVIRGLCEAIEAEADALNLYLATAPDRGGPNGLKGQRQKAWENAHAAMIAALAAARKLGLG